MVAKEKRPNKVETTPDRLTIKELGSERLGALLGVSPKDLVGASVADVAEKFRWQIDRELLFFRRVCGRVVKKDPVTGEYHGVPNATVHVEDTDCSFLGFFPIESRWFWLFPFGCRREEIATVTTDACGNFCVWIPRWDIDWVLRFRRERICLPDIVRPWIWDIIRDLKEFWPPPPPPPDPGPLQIDLEALPIAGSIIGRETAARIGQLSGGRSFGAPESELRELLMTPAFPEPFPPPLPSNIDESSMAGKLPIDSLEGREFRFDPKAYLGPFLRCRDVYTLEWDTIFDVPDITFRVTQDVDGDGDEETIYSEGYFDVRWNTGPIPPVTLVASGSAIASPICGGPTTGRACVDKPEIYTVGPMPLSAGYHDNAAGYALRPNRPAPGGLFSSPQVSPSQAPYRSALALNACHRLPGATQYRLLYESGGVGPVPFQGISWWAPTTPGQPTPAVLFTPDTDGWYDIRPAATLAFPDWVLHWPSSQFGLYKVWLVCRDAAGNPVGSPSDDVGFMIDNRVPNVAPPVISWRTLPAGVWQSLPMICPVIRRPAATDIEVRVQWSASADHFRSASIGFGGCGGGNPVRTGGAADYEHWYENFSDNAMARTSEWDVPSGVPDGAYTVGISAYGRGIHPSFDAGPIFDWYYNQGEAWTNPSWAIAIVTQV